MNSDDWLERTVHFNIFKGVKDIFSIEEIVKADTKVILFQIKCTIFFRKPKEISIPKPSGKKFC